MPVVSSSLRLKGWFLALVALAVMFSLGCSSDSADSTGGAPGEDSEGPQASDSAATADNDGMLPMGAAWEPLTIGTIGMNSTAGEMVTTDGAVWVLGNRFNVPVVWRSTDGVDWVETEIAHSLDGALRIVDIVDLPGGGLLGAGNYYMNCDEYEAPAGYRALQLCRASIPLAYRSDDNGATWRVIELTAMVPEEGEQYTLEGLAVHGGGVVAVGTVKGEDWRAQVWTSSDGEQWIPEADLRGVGGPLSVDQVISDGSSLVVFGSEHPCSTPSVNASAGGWYLGTSWANHVRLFAGTDPGALSLLGPDDVSLAQAPLDIDCAEVTDQTVGGLPYTQLDGLLVGGAITLVERRSAEAQESRESRSRAIATLVGGSWEVESTPELPSAAQRWLVDADGELAIVLRASDWLPEKVSFATVLRSGSDWTEVQSAHPVLGSRVGGVAAFGDAFLAAGTLEDDPFAVNVRSESSEVIVWRSTARSAVEWIGCEPGPSAECVYADLSMVAGYPDFAGADFAGADLTLARLDGGNFDGASFEGARLVGATTADASFAGASFVGSDLQAAEFDRLVDADLSGANLTGARLMIDVGVVLDGATLNGAILRVVRIDGSSPQVELSLANADLLDASINGPLGDEPLLVITDLTGATLEQTRFRAVDLSQADVSGVDLSTAIFDEDSVCPNGEPPVMVSFLRTCE